MDFSKILSALKLPLWVFGGITLASTALLLLPAGALQWLGIPTSYQAYRGYVGITLIVSFSLSAAGLIAMAWLPFAHWCTKQLELRKAKLRLRELAADERELLSQYFEKNTRSLPLSPKNGTAIGLVKEGILFIATERYYSPGALHDINIQPWAWSYLVKRKYLLK